MNGRNPRSFLDIPINITVGEQISLISAALETTRWIGKK